MNELIHTIASLRAKLRAAKRRLAEQQRQKPTSAFAPSGLDMLVGEMRSPIYKPVAIFDPCQTCEVNEYTIVRGSDILLTKPLGPFAMCSGDTLAVHLELAIPLETR